MREPCEYLEAPDYIERIDAATGRHEIIRDPAPELCMWALHAAARPGGMPPWVTRLVAPWRPGDCETCPCHVPKI